MKVVGVPLPPLMLCLAGSAGPRFSRKTKRFLQLLHHLIDNRAGECSLDHYLCAHSNPRQPIRESRNYEERTGPSTCCFHIAYSRNVVFNANWDFSSTESPSLAGGGRARF